MDINKIKELYDFTGKTVVITGGNGVLGGDMAVALAGLGANVVIADLNTDISDDLQKRLQNLAGEVSVFKCNVLERESLIQTKEAVSEKYGAVDILINAAGGNKPQATTSPDLSFFDLPKDALDFVLSLNLQGTILPSQIFGKLMAEQDNGVILNVSSMNAFRPLTRIPAYSAAKAAVSNFTQWLAVHLAQEYSSNIRVTAIAPGFFLTNQNRFLLTDEKSGELTARGKAIIDHTPMGKFGDPEDLIGAVLWLLSPASAFVSGIVVPIDGGFSAFSGV
jgi:NAD(P)-dependent dehydrogenase (short-subunit alcohol dehydrogenase family)